MKTPKDWFEEELSGEPLTQESVIEVLEMVQKETWNEALDKAAESAEVDINGDCDDKFSLRSQDGEWLVITPNQQSILKLKL